jgi:hypothetical protein
MIPMRANADNIPGQTRSGATARRARLDLVGDPPAESQPGEHTVFNAPAAEVRAFPAAARLDGSAIEGTIDATAVRADQRSHSSESNALLDGAPFTQAHRKPPSAPGSRTNDLLSELREISDQVNRMMSQVDRAIHRLGVHAGEPLRR